MTEEYDQSDATSNNMASFRVDTASNIYYFSRMDRSGYSARYLNKSFVTNSDVSDCSFSMHMYMPKKIKNLSGASEEKPSQPSQSASQSASQEQASTPKAQAQSEQQE